MPKHRIHGGDTLTVWKLDRLGRSMKNLLDNINELEHRGVGFRSLTENIDTTTPGGDVGARIPLWWYERRGHNLSEICMPFKFNATRRHRIPKARYRVTNWAEYDRGLVRRGDVRLWMSTDAIAGWRPPCRATPGGQRRFSNLAVETTLILGALCRFPLRAD